MPFSETNSNALKVLEAYVDERKRTLDEGERRFVRAQKRNADLSSIETLRKHAEWLVTTEISESEKEEHMKALSNFRAQFPIVMHDLIMRDVDAGKYAETMTALNAVNTPLLERLIGDKNWLTNATNVWRAIVRREEARPEYQNYTQARTSGKTDRIKDAAVACLAKLREHSDCGMLREHLENVISIITARTTGQKYKLALTKYNWGIENNTTEYDTLITICVNDHEMISRALTRYLPPARRPSGASKSDYVTYFGSQSPSIWVDNVTESSRLKLKVKSEVEWASDWGESSAELVPISDLIRNNGYDLHLEGGYSYQSVTLKLEGFPEVPPAPIFDKTVPKPEIQPLPESVEQLGGA